MFRAVSLVFAISGHVIVAALLCLFGGLSAAAAQTSELPVITRDGSGQTIIRATRISTPPRIDGRLDDAVYRDVAPVMGFIQQEPREGEPVTEPTQAWVMFDDDNIYIACRCSDARPETIESKDMRRDSSNQRFTDSFGVLLDTFHDKRNGYIFTITPSGGFTDATVTDERVFNPDWNTVWDNSAARTPDGWAAEMAIPFKSLRYAPGGRTWGINIRRLIRTKNEYSFIVPMSRAWTSSTAMMHVAAAATLTDLEVPPATLNLEAKPYVLSSSRTDRLARPIMNNDFTGDAGFDVKYGITKALTADFTYRTDCAQVEDDEAQVNLTRFALSFPEKREFFLDGAGIFTSFGTVGSAAVSGSGSDAPSLFYSRRIGLAGSRAVPIIGGGRLTGRVGKWTIGAINMQADDDAAANVRQTNFGVLRLRRDVGARSTVGGMVTTRSVTQEGRGSNVMYGLDSSFSLFTNLYIAGYAARTSTTGVSGRDYSYRGNVTYGGDRWGFLLDRTAVEDNFKPEVGFLRRSAFRSNFGGLRFSPRPGRTSRVRQYHFEGSLEYVTNTRNQLESRQARGNFRMDMHNGDSAGATYTEEHEALVTPFGIATGVRIPVGGYTFHNARLFYTSAPQRRVSGTFSVEAGGFYAGTRRTAAYRGRIEVTPRLALEPNLSFNRINLPQGNFSNTLVGNRATFTISPRTFVAALVQYTSGTTSILTNVRLRWEYSPGSEMFIVYSEGRDTDPLAPLRGNPLENRGLTIKITKLLRM
jgi:hypothetical protein